jgi:AcrR family transcriptional regulator
MMEKTSSSIGVDSRARLLTAAIAYLEANGLGDVSLRELARAIGTSHRMLIYHFGSREGLRVAIAKAIEAAQLDVLAGLADDVNLEPAETIGAMWERVADPALSPHERLFFELYGQALQGRPGTAEFLDGIVEAWVVPGAEYLQQHGLTLAEARAQARLGLAVVRGLLLDLLATQDRQGVDAAMASYVEMVRLSNKRAQPDA